MRLAITWLAAAFALDPPAAAQCTFSWAPALSGIAAVMQIVSWDPDGTGPQRPRWVVAEQNEIKVLNPDTNAWVVIATTRANALLAMPDGSLLAGGDFTTIGGVPADGIARWNGTSWSSMWVGMQTTHVTSLVLLPDGSPVLGAYIDPAAGGSLFNIVMRWNGTVWNPLGGQLPLVSGPLVATLPGGIPVVAGCGGVQQWTGTAWIPLGTGVPLYTGDLKALRDGSLLVGVFNGGSNYAILRWDGSAWTPIYSTTNQGPGQMLELLDGNVLFVVSRIGSSEVRRWNGATTWLVASASGGTIYGGLVPLPDGSIGFYGDFISPYVYYARLVSNCLPVSTTVAAGCAGSGGGNMLTTDLPWRGGVLHSFANGMPTRSLVVSVFGWGTAPVTLSSLLPQGQPGCTLHPTPDFVDLLVTTNGSVSLATAVPNNPTMFGLQFYHQMIPGELDAASNLVAVTATNTVRLLLGYY